MLFMLMYQKMEWVKSNKNHEKIIPFYDLSKYARPSQVS